MSQVIAGCCCTPSDPCRVCGPSFVQITWPSITFSAKPFSAPRPQQLTIPAGNEIVPVCVFNRQGRNFHAGFQTTPAYGNGTVLIYNCNNSSFGTKSWPWAFTISLLSPCYLQQGTTVSDWRLHVYASGGKCKKIFGSCQETSALLKPWGYMTPGSIDCSDDLLGRSGQQDDAIGTHFTCAASDFGSSNPFFANPELQYVNSRGRVDQCDPTGTYGPGFVVS